VKSENLPRAIEAAQRALDRAEAAGTITAAEAATRRADLARMARADRTTPANDTLWRPAPDAKQE
jgi:hypothetical protein